jgi:RNA polymerase sigma-70 factor (ECF subfamily)
MNEADQFEAIVTEHYKPLYRFALSLSRSEADALDLTQHTFHVWALKGHQLRNVTKVKTWLYTTLYRAFLQVKRRHKQFPLQELEMTVEDLPTVAPVQEDRADALQVLPALSRVDQVYQAAVALFYLEDYAYQEIANLLEVPVGTVKSRIARGVEQLRGLLLAEGPRSHSGLGHSVFPAPPEIQTPSAPERNPSRSRPGPALVRVISEWEGDEWDLSSTRIREPVGAA